MYRRWISTSAATTFEQHRTEGLIAQLQQLFTSKPLLLEKDF
jgi:hypothetical protein